MGSGILEENEAKREYALHFAVNLGVLRRCQYHDIVYEGSGDLEYAYKEAASTYKRGEHQIFASQREFTDYVKAVVQDHPSDECPGCDKWKND